MRAGNADHPVTEALHQGLNVHCDEGLILNDEDVGSDLGGKLTAGFLNQTAQGG